MSQLLSQLRQLMENITIYLKVFCCICLLLFSLITQPWHIIPNPPTFVLFKVESILLVSDNLLHVDNTAVFELPQDLDLSNGCDWETLLFIVQTHFLQSHQFTFQVGKRIYRASQNENSFSVFNLKHVSTTVTEVQELFPYLCLCPWPCTLGHRCLLL